MRKMLEEKLARFEELENQMSDPEVLGNSNRISAVAREHGSLVRLVNKYRAFKKVSLEMGEVTTMLESDDADSEEAASNLRIQGIEDARRGAESLLDRALLGIEGLCERAEPLRELARFAVRRSR